MRGLKRRHSAPTSAPTSRLGRWPDEWGGLAPVVRNADDGSAPTLARPLRSHVAQWASGRGIDIDAPTALRAILIWSRLHGFVSLEIGGNFAGMGIDGESLFEVEIAEMAAFACRD